MQGCQEREQTTAAADDEPVVGVDGSELDDDVRALPDRVTPGLSFLVVLNIPGQMCDEFEEKVKERFIVAGFSFCDCQVSLYHIVFQCIIMKTLLSDIK